MAGKFKLKPVTCGVPRSSISNFTTTPSILLNPARVAGNNSTPLDADNNWSWKSRYLISTGGSSIIYLDGNNTPFIVSFSVTVPSAFNVRVVATLHQEYGVFGISVPDHNTVIFDDTISLADGSDVSYTAVTSLDGGAEQSPSGGETLLNIKGTFVNTSGAYELKTGSRTLAGILKATISGTVNDSGGGLSGSASVYKTTAECSGAKAEVSTSDNGGTFHFNMATNNTSATTDGLVAFDGHTIGEGGTHNGVSHQYLDVTQECAITKVDSAWNGSGPIVANGDPNYSNFTNVDLSTITAHEVINRAYYDNDGQIHTLGFKYTHDERNRTLYDATINQGTQEEQFQWWAHTSRYASVAAEWVFEAGSRIAVSGGANSSITLGLAAYTSDNVYTVDAMLDGAVVETDVYEYANVQKRSNTFSWNGFIHEPLAGGVVKGTVQSNMPIDGGDFVSVSGGDYTFLATGEAYTAGFSASRTVVWDSIGGGETTTYEVTENGITTSYASGSQPANKGFDVVESKITGSRFISLIYDNGDTTQAHSAYGSTAVNHKDNIAYDHYDDTIIDYD